MAIVTDVYQLRLFSTYLDESMVNVFHYVISEVGDELPVSSDLIAAFEDVVMNLLTEVTSAGVTYNTIDAFNIRDVTDFATVSPPRSAYDQGLVLGEALPAFFTYKYRYQRVALGTRYGYKRFSGVPESFVDGNKASSGGKTLLEDLAVELGRALTPRTGVILFPYVARRPIILGITPPGYGTNKATFEGFSTQNTRKR